jgi:hypothetical protein
MLGGFCGLLLLVRGRLLTEHLLLVTHTCCGTHP